MRKFSVFTRAMMSFACALLTFTACSDEETVLPGENPGADSEEAILSEVPMKTIRISAGMAKGEGASNSRTTLAADGRVLWDAGDQYTIINEDPKDKVSNTLRITLNEPGSGLGVSTVSGANVSNEVNLKYSDIKVLIGGEDVTSKILNTSKNDNGYKVGATNSDGKYQYTNIGSEMKAKLYGSGGNKTFVIARCTSSDENVMLSGSKQAVITLTGIQWKYNLGSWNSLNENNTTMVNGASISGVDLKNVADYRWMHGICSDVTLTSEAGNPYGIFEGEIPVNSEIGNNTMAVFPGREGTTYNKGNLTITVPQTQSYVENSFDHKANIMVGNIVMTDDHYDATFFNMMGVVKLSLKGSGNVSTISITDRAGKNLCGTATLPAADYKSGISTDMISGGSATLTMNCNNLMLSEETKDIYFVVPVGAFTRGCEIAIRSGDTGDEFKTSKDLEIERGVIVEMPTINVDNYEIFNIENEILTQYLDKGPYSSWGADSYFYVSRNVTDLGKDAIDKDYPNSKTVTWVGSTSAEYKVTLTDKTNKKDIFTNRSVTGTSFSFYNMVPDHKYVYTILDGSDNVVTSGKFIAKGRVRMVTVDDTFNFRDLGGWTGLGGNKIKYEWIYRCGSLNGKFNIGTGVGTNYSHEQIAAASNYNMFTANSTRQLVDMGIKSELDLRFTIGEGTADSKYPHKYCIGVSHTNVPNWTYYHINTSPATSNPRTDSGVVKDVAWIIDQVVNHNNPVAFHCMSGADRTGAVAFTILSLLGVSEGNIALEYEITNFSHEQKVIKGKSEIRGKYTSENKNGFYGNAFKNYGSSATINGVSCTMSNLQEKAYAYLNHTFSNTGKAIKASDLDKFIEKMLGMPAGTYQHPSWATDNNRNSLESIFETDQNK